MDAQKCAQLEPKNKSFQDLLRQLGAQMQQKVGYEWCLWRNVSLLLFMTWKWSHICVYIQAAQLSSTDLRVQQMFKLLLDSSAPISDRQKVGKATFKMIIMYNIQCLRCSLLCFNQAAQNLVVLSREDAGAEQIFRNDGVKLLQNLLDSQQEDLILSALRTLVGLCTGHQSRVSNFPSQSSLLF